MELKFTECWPEYWEFVRNLRNDSRVIDGFIDQTFIKKEDQINYMSRHWKNYYIALWNNFPCGYVGVINNDIRICVDPNYQQVGVGKFLLNELKKTNLWSNNIVAKVKVDNKSSLRLFESCDFRQKYIILEPNNAI